MVTSNESRNIYGQVQLPDGGSFADYSITISGGNNMSINISVNAPSLYAVNADAAKEGMRELFEKFLGECDAAAK